MPIVFSRRLTNYRPEHGQRSDIIPMAIIHYLNVKQGDCSIIQHNTGRVTVIDVSNARLVQPLLEQALERERQGVKGNFNQKDYPVNPISYLNERGISEIFRFILTHPDMDHMDGIKDFFDTFGPYNFWDTDNSEEKEFEEGSPFREEDWSFYKSLRDGTSGDSPKRLALLAGAKGSYWSKGKTDGESGDGLSILAPTSELLSLANETGDNNHCSYVLLYTVGDRKIVFGGDSHDKAWDYILQHHSDKVSNVDLLIAPHHGRHSDRSFDFLDVLRPRLTFFGNASAEHLAYDAWSNRDLPHITNNQAGCMIVETGPQLKLYVTHKPFAMKVNPSTTYSETHKAYFCLDF